MTDGPTLVRSATAADAAAIDAVHAAAFAGDRVPRLVRALRAAAPQDSTVEFVALDRDDVVGHVLVTPIELETAPGSTRPLACLSPLGVRPEAQHRGVGAALVRAALAETERRGEPAVVLEGAPGYYRRFGFVAARAAGLRRPSQRIPEPAFQVRIAPGAAVPGGRVLYPGEFWDADAVGLPFDGVPWLDELERACRFVERAVAGAVLDRAVPACPGWDVGDLLRHLGVVQRVVTSWVEAGHRPRIAPSHPQGADVRSWFADGWRRLQETLDAPTETPAATWCAWDATIAFWHRRQAHEHLVHALDVAQALGLPAPLVPSAVALDGIDEVLRLWLGTRLGPDVGGAGEVVRVVAAGEFWTVGLHDRLVEVHHLAVTPDAVVEGDPVTLYRWLWGRGGSDGPSVAGDVDAVERLRGLIARATA